MIAVIADDLTGAAELGGLGLRYALQVEINTEVQQHTKADLLIIATDTRSLSQQEAVAVMTKVTKEVKLLQPECIFKKIDSVLRGHIVPETEAQLSVLGIQKALIVPANPALERTITNGTYFFKGHPIHQSSFSQDPDFPIASSRIQDMLRTDKVQVCTPYDRLPDKGLIVGEVQTAADLQAWTNHIDTNTLLAGGAGFFSAILQTLSFKPVHKEQAKNLNYSRPSLFVCGTTFQKSRNALKKEKAKGGPVSYMPRYIVQEPHPSDGDYTAWSNEICSMLHQHQTAYVAIDADTTNEKNKTYSGLRLKMAKVIEKVFQQTRIPELFIEGGSTAMAILQQLGITRFYPVQEMAPGVIRMSINDSSDFHLTIKPGSYDWPDAIWKIHQ